jgi:hypothetical protein
VASDEQYDVKRAAVAALIPGLRPCGCTTHCEFREYFASPPEPAPAGVVCRERSALPRLSEGTLHE